LSGEKDKVHSSVEAAVLEAIVEDVDAARGGLLGGESGGVPVRADPDGDLGGAGDENGFISVPRGCVGERRVNASNGGGLPTVPAGEHIDSMAVGAEELGERDDDRSFPCPSGRDAADGDNGTVEAACGE
jgi:hypothetical protein